RNGVPVGTGQAYSFTVDRSTEGEYWVVVSNQCGQTQSRRVVVTAYLPPQITLQPQSVRVSQGQRIVLRVEATGKLPLRYQWQKNGQDIPGATSNTYVIERAQKADEGRYRCRVQNDCGEASSNEAEVVVEAVSVSSGTEAGGYRLYPVTPSPAVGTALVRFVAPGMNPIRLALYDAYGRRVATVVEGNFEDEHTLWLRPEEFGLAPGVYMLRLETRDVMLQQPFVVVR
ncbi:MAG: immunoglobulin domain-containing protein, partial [Chlorobiota bacterium]